MSRPHSPKAHVLRPRNWKSTSKRRKGLPPPHPGSVIQFQSPTQNKCKRFSHQSGLQIGYSSLWVHRHPSPSTNVTGPSPLGTVLLVETLQMAITVEKCRVFPTVITNAQVLLGAFISAQSDSPFTLFQYCSIHCHVINSTKFLSKPRGILDSTGMERE